MASLVLVALLAAAGLAQPPQSRTAVFVGSTPSGEAMRTLLGIPREANVELIEWELTLADTAAAGRDATYHLRYKFGPTRPNQPGLDADAPANERRGTWKTHLRAARDGQQARRMLDGIVALDNGLSLLRVGDALLHVLAPDGSLISGNGGWSYTLVRRDAAERDPDPRLTSADPGDPSRTVTRASGASVFGVFDGRTPCQGIARELGVAARPGCWKAKWRLTLFQDAATHQPTTYWLEGSLYRTDAREGSWRIVRDGNAELYELAPPQGESPALLLKGSERVLFFLDRQRKPLSGNARNAYTLDRRSFDR
jgi:hypothetical protein